MQVHRTTATALHVCIVFFWAGMRFVDFKLSCIASRRANISWAIRSSSMLLNIVMWLSFYLTEIDSATTEIGKLFFTESVKPGGHFIKCLSVFFTYKFPLSQSDARISVAYKICQWKTLTKHLMKSPPPPPQLMMKSGITLIRIDLSEIHAQFILITLKTCSFQEKSHQCLSLCAIYGGMPSWGGELKGGCESPPPPLVVWSSK